MTDTRNDGGPAYPVLHSIDGNWVKEPLDKYSGMSLRDYFAAAALQGILSNPKRLWCSPRHYADDAYSCADAMLAERNKIND